MAMQLWQLLRDQVCGEGHKTSLDAADHRLAQAIQQEEYEALRLAISLRTLVLAAVTVLLTVELRWPLALSLYCYLAVLAVSGWRSEEHTSELQSLMRISYAVFCLKKKNNNRKHHTI